jgi:hypothetical protein
MKQFYIWIAIFSFYQDTLIAQSCPLNSTSSISSNPNTFYPAIQANVNSGTSSIVLDAVTYGTTPISPGDILLVIQMQGSQINSSNSSSYGSGAAAGNGSGYLNNGNLLAGTMEYVVASNSVPLTGGTVNLVSALVNSYKNAPFGTDGQYTYQVVRVPVYYDLILTGPLPITAPRWNGASGGLVVLYAVDNINLNSQTIDASGFGFRGGGGRVFNGAGSGSSADYITLSVSNANGGKGEGIAGTPKYLNDNNAFLDVSGSEGYPNGSYGRGAPGNAGGGGTDGNPSKNNAENTGGGGGANGGAGGNGGNAWSSATPSGGKPGSVFAQASPSRLVMGGGGGAGTTNDGTGIPKNGFASSGVAGGGIIILIANSISGPGTIKANGASGNNSVVNDGAGGAVLLYANTGSLSTVTVSAKGGNGGSNEVVNTGNNPAHGPGGGGGGGIIYANTSLGASNINGGNSGLTAVNSTNYGATAGITGILSTTITQIQTPKFPLTCVVLSVTFLDLAAKQDNGLVTINWDVAEQVNTEGYVVEKSLDGINFTAIGSVPRQSGSTDKVHYEYPDNSGFDKSGIIYYRIKEVEGSGRSMYSKIISIQAGGLSGKLSVYPNPVKESATVSFISSTQTTISLRLFDLKGSVIWQQQYQAHVGQNNVTLDNIRTIPNGMYILQCFDGLKPEQVKLLVNH